MSDPLPLNLFKLDSRLQEILGLVDLFLIDKVKTPATDVAEAVNQFVTDYSHDEDGPCALFNENCKTVWKLEREFCGSHILRCDELNEINKYSGQPQCWGGRKKEALGAVCEKSLRFVVDSMCPVDWQDHSEQLKKALRLYLSLRGHDVDTTPPAAKPEQDEGRGGKGKKPKTRKKRSEPKADKSMFDAWGTGQYQTFAALAQNKGVSKREAKLAIDRHRKRQAAKATAPKKPGQ